MRTKYMAYITGSMEAVDFYCRAFHTISRNCFKASDDDDFYAHAEIVISEQTVLGISEKAHYATEFSNGSSMQFWVTFDDKQSAAAAYEVLKEQGRVHYALAPCEWCELLADVTNKYGVNWLLNVD